MNRTSIAFFALAKVAPLFFLLSSMSCRHVIPACEDTEVVRVSSPAGSQDAIVHVRNCGATSDYSTAVAIVEHGSKYDDDGANDFYVADSAHGRVREGARGEIGVSVKWTSEKNLVVSTPSNARAFAAKAIAGNGVTIAYESVASPN